MNVIRNYNMNIVSRIRKEIPEDEVIPKPETSNPYTVKGWGRRRGEPALVYRIPNPGNPKYPYEKGITETEFELAYGELNRSGEFTHRWFKQELVGCHKEGSCNFTSIGGIFELLGVGAYSGSGAYKKV